MYEGFFGFTRRPFSLTPDADFLYWTRQHRQAFDLVCLALMRHAPISLVTGEVGAGKTTLIQKLLRDISDQHEVALLSNVAGESGDLLRWILTAYGRQGDPATHAEALREVEDLLGSLWEGGRRSVLIVDEAQNVSDSGIETLRLLTNLDVGKVAPLSLVLVGQPQLRDRLTDARFGAIRQRLGASFHLGPMSFDETIGYVRSRLQIAEGPPDLFDDGAIAAVHARAAGIPRLTNLLCDVCLVSAFGEDRTRVDAAFAESALAEALEIGGLGGLAAEAGQAEKNAAMARDLVAPRVRVATAAAHPVMFAASETPRRPSGAPTLHLVSNDSPDADEPAPPPPLRLQPREEPERKHAQKPHVEEARPVAWAGSAWRRRLAPVAGAAVAAALSGAALILPTSWADGAQVVSSIEAALAPPARLQTRDALLATTIPARDAAGGEPLEATLAPMDPSTGEPFFDAALDDATADRAAAAVAYSRAAARGHARAAYYLGQMYETGDGVAHAPGTARAWYAKASGQVAAAQDRLSDLDGILSQGPGFAEPLFSSAEGGSVELVWQGRGPFVVELAADQGAGADVAHATALTAVRLATADDFGWWRVRPAEGEPSDWRPIDGHQTSLSLR